jgi:hypothetical protein
MDREVFVKENVGNHFAARGGTTLHAPATFEVLHRAAHMLIVSFPAELGAGLPGPALRHTRLRHEAASQARAYG